MYQILIGLVLLFGLGYFIIFGIDRIMNGLETSGSTTIELDTDDLEVITNNLNYISDSSWNKTIDGKTLKDIYINNYKKYISNITSNLELGNITYEYTGSIGIKYYNIKLNKSKWFLFNNINNKSSNDFYIVDNHMNYHMVSVDITNKVDLYLNDNNIVTYNVNNYEFKYDTSSGNLYGNKYLFTEDDINYYFTLLVNIKELKLSYDKLYNFMTDITNNIEISFSNDINSTYVKLPSYLEAIKVFDDLTFDFKSNVSIIDWYNDLDNKSIVIDLIDNKTNIKYKFEERIDFIDSINNKGLKLYNYYNHDIYLKYNSIKNKKTKQVVESINGIVLSIDDRLYTITFDKIVYKNQTELNNILDALNSFMIYN